MLKVIDDVVYIRRGDDEVLDVNVGIKVDEEFVPVELGETETLTLTVRETPEEDSPVVFSSTGAPGSTRIVINHADTAKAEYGKYSADVQMLTAEGLRKTVWPVVNEENIPRASTSNMKNFVILPEVTMT